MIIAPDNNEITIIKICRKLAYIWLEIGYEKHKPFVYYLKKGKTLCIIMKKDLHNVKIIQTVSWNF